MQLEVVDVKGRSFIVLEKVSVSVHRVNKYTDTKQQTASLPTTNIQDTFQADSIGLST